MASRLLVYLCSEGLDLVFQAALLPWAFWYLVHTNYLEGHWGRAVISYGTLCSVQALGRFLGRACSPQVVSSSDVTMRTRQVFGMLLLGGVSIVLCMTNRYFLMLLAYFGAGFAGANLVGACSPNYRLNAGLSLGGDFDSALGSNSVSGVAAMRSAGLDLFVRRLFESADFLILPSMGCAVPDWQQVELGHPSFERRRLAAMHGWMGFVNYLGLPALNLPIARDAHQRPICVQVLARPFAEHRLLDFAAQFEMKDRTL
jgi:hypothetical protein